MIGKISGILEEKTTQQALINVHGVSYELEVPLSTGFALPDLNEKVQLYTHFVVREDAQLLYGFHNKQDRDMFRLLIKVNGVGPKLGITILSGLDSRSLARCIEENDVSTLIKLPGIGKKTAERLLIELRDKVKKLYPENATDQPTDRAKILVASASIEEEAEGALIALGYRPQDAAKTIKATRENGQTLEQLIRAALKKMV